MHKYADIYVHSHNEIPKGEHYAIIVSNSIFVPGDQRSIDAPGHGYPAHSESYVGYEVYNSKEDFILELETRDPNKCIGIHVSEIFTLSPKVQINAQR